MLCGGVGAARFLAGAVQVVEPSSITAVVNTADDAVINGLAISPDLDTVVYTLAGAIDPERGWGLGGETWTAMDALERYAAVRPASSEAAITWFRLGDRDLATHLYRTARRAEGATLTEITAEIAAAWNVSVRILPMTDDAVSTRLVLGDGAELAFQDYFVRLRHDVEVSAVHIDTAGAARPTAAVLAAIGEAASRRHRPVQPARVDPAAARPARHRRRPGAAARHRRRRVADRRWQGAQGPRRPAAARARPRADRRRRRPAVRADRRQPS